MAARKPPALTIRQYRHSEAIAFYLASGFDRLDVDVEPEQEWDLSLFSKALKFLP